MEPSSQFETFPAKIVHEFIKSILENRKSCLNKINGANIVAVEIVAHESVIKGSEITIIPNFLQEQVWVKSR